MAKQLLALGTTANDGTGDSLRAGGTKVNENFTEIYDSLGGSAGAGNLLVSTASPNLGDSLTWNGTAFAPGQGTNKATLEQNLNFNGYNIVAFFITDHLFMSFFTYSFSYYFNLTFA